MSLLTIKIVIMLKNIVCNKKKMSFLKTIDPVKRDLIFKEYLEITKNIRKKIATETQFKATAREITEGIENLPQATQRLGEASGEKEPLDLSFSCVVTND